MVTKQNVFEMLKNFGILPQDKVTMHISLKAVGEIENGAEGLLDALREYLSEGLLIIPTHTWMGITERPYYSPEETKSCIGVLPNIAAFHPDAVRSYHPTHSVAVFGKQAADYVALEKTYTTPEPSDNCLSRLCEEHGKILLVGVGFENNTYIHSVEEKLEIPNRIGDEIFHIKIKGRDGNLQEIEFRGHAVEGLTCSISSFYPLLEKPFFHMGALSYGSLGNAKVICCDAYKSMKAYEYLSRKIPYDFLLKNEEIPEAYYK